MKRKSVARNVAGPILTIVASLAITLLARRRGYELGLHTIVRCRDGHLFTTIWIPGVSVKSVRLGPIRLQKCPVGEHWTFVRPVKTADLSEEDLALARSLTDRRIP